MMCISVNGRSQIRPARVDFGRVKPDVVTEGEVLLRGATSNDAVKVEGVETETTILAAKVESGRAGECRVALRLLPGAELGPGSSTVTIRTSHPGFKVVKVPVTWKAEGELQATPEEIVVVVRSGATNAVVRHVAIRSRERKTVRLASTWAPGMAVVASPLSDGRGVLLKVTVSPGGGAVGPVVARFDDGTRMAIPVAKVVATDFAEP